jgi:hypothetical protein
MGRVDVVAAGAGAAVVVRWEEVCFLPLVPLAPFEPWRLDEPPEVKLIRRVVAGTGAVVGLREGRREGRARER